jgi:hypothetical protein
LRGGNFLESGKDSGEFAFLGEKRIHEHLPTSSRSGESLFELFARFHIAPRGRRDDQAKVRMLLDPDDDIVHASVIT